MLPVVLDNISPKVLLRLLQWREPSQAGLQLSVGLSDTNLKHNVTLLHMSYKSFEIINCFNFEYLPLLCKLTTIIFLRKSVIIYTLHTALVAF
jgi:hypothetical protein